MKTKGSKNLIRVTLSDLNKCFKDSALIPVSTAFARQNLLMGEVPEGDEAMTPQKVQVDIEEVSLD